MDSDEPPSWDLDWDPELRVLIVRVRGAMTVEASVTVLQEISAGGAWPAHVATVWDVRAASFPNASGAKLRSLADRRAGFDDRLRARVAMVADDDLNFGLMRMFEMLSAHDEGAFCVFRDFDAALRWAAER
ncbi:MAG: hypothetical protein V2J24_23310 [Pseudomonadales bacterium]|jgi:hypothetical protein|nr:hypothetical protein [Pseudomonadales bacterium]